MKTPTFVVAALLGAASVHPPAATAQTLQLTWVDRTGKTIATVGPGGPYRGPDLAPDGKRLAIHRHDESKTPGRPGGGDVFLFNSGPGPGTPLTGDSPDVEHAMPIWSPDGTRIVFGSTRKGKGGLYVKRADGTGTEELLIESETSKVPMSWSSDGKHIIYWSPGNIQWVLPLTGDRKPFQLSSGATSHAQISPDGKWVAYQDATGRAEIFVKPFPTGSGRVQISQNGGTFARWRGDGRELFFMSEGKMMATAVTMNGAKMTAGTPTQLFDHRYVNLFHPGGNYHVFAVTRDGQRFLIPRPEPAPGADDPTARTLTVFDREGRTTGTVGERGLYNNLVFSPDRTRVALLRNDPANGTTDVWVFDVATGKGTRLTSSTRDERQGPAIWSPDGRQIAYIVSRKSVEAIYRRSSDGNGPEQLVYTLSGANIGLQEWTSDGRYITYYSPQLGGNVVFALPLSGEQKPIEVVRSQFPLLHARLSPDNRFVAFRSNESGKDEVWVRRFDPSTPSTDKWKVSTEGGTGPVYWRGDGKELNYLALDRGMMSVAVRTDTGFAFDAPRLLFKVPEAFPAGAGIGPATSMSRDGERFIFAVPRTPPPPAPLPAIAVFDRQGQAIQTIGEPGRYSGATFSPDRSRILVRKQAETGNTAELLSIDVKTGAGTLIASGQLGLGFSFLWSRDGRQIFYVAPRPGGFQTIMRKMADGTGSEEMLYQYVPGAPVNLNDITPDGRFLAFESGGVILMLPLMAGDAKSREAVEIIREEYFAFNAKFSPDGRAIAYVSTETDRSELYIHPFDPATGKPVGQAKRRVTSDGASGAVAWRADGRELYYIKGDLDEALIMAVGVPAPSTSQGGTPAFLFRANGATTLDGQTFAVVKPR